MSDTKTCIKQIIIFDRIMEEKKLDVKLQATSKDVVLAWAKVTKLCMGPNRERKLEVSAAKCKAHGAT
jgi:hypothetical protein